MKVRLANCGDKDLIVQRSGGPSTAVEPLSFGRKIAREFVEIDIGANEVVILRCRGAKDPDGVTIKDPV